MLCSAKVHNSNNTQPRIMHTRHAAGRAHKPVGWPSSVVPSDDEPSASKQLECVVQFVSCSNVR
jgi:hypothetical protein